MSLLENLETRIQNIDKKQKNILDFEKKLFGHEFEEGAGEIDEETGEELTKTIKVEGIKDKFDNILKSLSDQKNKELQN